MARACVQELFGRNNRRSSRTSYFDAKERLVAFFESSEVFDTKHEEKPRVLHPNFFWVLVRPPTNVGSEKDKINSGKVPTDKERNIFQSLCGNTDNIVGDFERDETKDEEDELSDSESVFEEEKMERWKYTRERKTKQLRGIRSLQKSLNPT